MTIYANIFDYTLSRKRPEGKRGARTYSINRRDYSLVKIFNTKKAASEWLKENKAFNFYDAEVRPSDCFFTDIHNNDIEL